MTCNFCLPYMVGRTGELNSLGAEVPGLFALRGDVQHRCNTKPRPRQCPARRPSLFASKLTLAYNSLVTFGGASDPILKLAVSLRQLLGYYVAAADCTAVYDVRGKRDSLARAKFMVCH